MAKGEVQTNQKSSEVAREADDETSLLDELLVEYLDLLDQYQTQRKSLSDLLASVRKKIDSTLSSVP